MSPAIIDAILVVLILGMTYALYAEGLWGAALVFFNVLFASMIALNFYEPLARLMVENAPGAASFADLTCLGGVFLVSLIIFKILTDSIAPTFVRIPGLLDQIGRLVFGAAGALVTMAMLILLLHTAPVDRKIFRSIDYQSGSPFNLGLDRRLLAFFQYTTGKPFSVNNTSRNDPEYGNANVFDPRGSWLIDHQNARPYPAGSDEFKVPEADGGVAVADPGGGGAGGGIGDAGAMPGAMAPGVGSGPGIPGGTAGAAAGLAPTNP